MANQPIQLPNIDLPGAEYFGLAPNRTIALQGRRRHVISSPLITAPATTDSVNAIGTELLESGFTETSAIYLHAFWLTIAPRLGGLVFSATLVGFFKTPATNFPIYIVGSPTLTSPTLNIGTVLLNDRDKFIAAKDIIDPPGGSLLMQTQVNVNNPEAVPVQFQTFATVIYTRLDGVVE